MEAARSRPAGPAPPRAGVVKRVVLASLIALATLNIWTGAPLLALWVGSRLQSGTQATMSSVFIVILLFAALCFALVRILAHLTRAYDQAIGAVPKPRQQAPWLRSMRGDRPKDLQRARKVTAPEKIMIAGVVLAVIAFEVWFFFFASSPLPKS